MGRTRLLKPLIQGSACMANCHSHSDILVPAQIMGVYCDNCDLRRGFAAELLWLRKVAMGKDIFIFCSTAIQKSSRKSSQCIEAQEETFEKDSMDKVFCLADL